MLWTTSYVTIIVVTISILDTFKGMDATISIHAAAVPLVVSRILVVATIVVKLLVVDRKTIILLRQKYVVVLSLF